MQNNKEEGFSDKKLLQLLIMGFVICTYLYIFLKIVFIK